MNFQKKEKISQKNSTDMILDNMIYSNYKTMVFIKNYNIPINKKILISHFNYNSDKTIEDYAKEARDFSKYCVLENILDYNPKWKTKGGFNVVRLIGDEIIASTEKLNKDVEKRAVEIAINSLDGIFYDSYNCFNRSTENSDISDFISAVNKGISAIEHSIKIAAADFNFLNKKDILIDNKENKVSFEKKIDDWFPIITGKKFDKSDKEWESFLKLKKFRDDYDQHFKGFYYFDYENVCNLMNLYKCGIAGMLFKLKKMFNHRISSLIIRAKYYPEIFLVKN